MTRTIRLPKPASVSRSLPSGLSIFNCTISSYSSSKPASKREPVAATIIGPEALRDLSAFMRENTIAVLVVEVR